MMKLQVTNRNKHKFTQGRPWKVTANWSWTLVVSRVIMTNHNRKVMATLAKTAFYPLLLLKLSSAAANHWHPALALESLAWIQHAKVVLLLSPWWSKTTCFQSWSFWREPMHLWTSAWMPLPFVDSCKSTVVCPKQMLSSGGMTTVWCWKTSTQIIATTKLKWSNNSSMVSWKHVWYCCANKNCNAHTKY